METPEIELRVKPAEKGTEITKNPDPIEVAESITFFPSLKTHHINDIGLYVNNFEENGYSSRLCFCLAIPDYAVVTYSDSRDIQQIYVSISGVRPVRQKTFKIDDGGGDDLILSTRFLIPRETAIDFATEFLDSPQFDLHDDTENWGDYTGTWH